VKEIYRKLEVGSRAEATLAASRLGLVDAQAR
jgi:DNA-binding NarL/FixJ family response regulator